MIFACPHCTQSLEADQEWIGYTIDCPTCTKSLTIETPEPEPTTPGFTATSSETTRYTFGDVIEVGGMGRIIAAEDKSLHRPVVVKQLIDPDNDSPESRALIREAKITARLTHPGIVPIHELDHDADGNLFYSMKHIQGESVHQLLKRIREGDSDTITRWPLEKLLRIFIRICDTMAYAHGRNIVHRDLKPANVMLGPHGEVMVIDWGIAKVLDASEVDPVDILPDATLPDEGEIGNTLEGSIMGSPAYMPPEQANGEIAKIDTRSDVFSLGAILFEMLTLHPPYAGPNLKTILTKAQACDRQTLDEITDNFAPARKSWPHWDQPDLPAGLLAVANAAMNPRREDRYQNATDLRGEIDAWLAGQTTRAENAGIVTIIRLFLKRNAAAARIVFVGGLISILAAAAFGLVNIRQANNAEIARSAAVGYVETTEKETELRRQDRARLIPGYLRRARQLANQSGDKLQDALTLAKLALDYVGEIPPSQSDKLKQYRDAHALHTALSFATHQKIPEQAQSDTGDRFADHPSIAYIASHSQILDETRRLPEQMLSRIQLAYTETGLSRLAGETTSLQKKRVENYRERLQEAWQGNHDVEWKLELEPSIVGEHLLSSYHNKNRPGYAAVFEQLARENPGNFLLLIIKSGSELPDLDVLKDIPVDGLALTANRPLSSKQYNQLNQHCTWLKNLWWEVPEPADFSFLTDKPLVVLQIKKSNLELDLSPLQSIHSLRVFVTGENKFSLAPLAGKELIYYSGPVPDGNLEPLRTSKLIQLSILRPTPKVTDLSPLKDMPIERFRSEIPFDATNNWETISSWPLQSLTQNHFTELDQLDTPIPTIRELFYRTPPTEPLLRLFPNVEQIKTGNRGTNMANLSVLPELRRLFLDFYNNSRSHHFELSPLLTCPNLEQIDIGNGNHYQLFPESVALPMVRNDWPTAETQARTMLEKVRNHLAFHFAEYRVEALIESIQQAATNETPVPEQYISPVYSYGNSRYQLVNCRLDWQSAKAFAEATGGHLATINTRAEYNFLRRQFASTNRDIRQGNSIWIGVYNEAGTRKWLTGEPFTPTAFDRKLFPPQRNKSLGFPAWQDDRINEYHKSYAWPFLIEWSAPGKTETTTLPGAEPDADGWHPLGNGKTLDGWTTAKPEHLSYFTALPETGAIAATGGSGLLYIDIAKSDHLPHGAFEFECEISTAPNSNGGIWFNGTINHHNYPKDGFELQVNSNPSRDIKTGGLHPGLARLADLFHTDGEWVKLRLIHRGTTIRTFINGQPGINYQYNPEEPRFQGPRSLAIQSHSGRVEYRNLRWRKL